MRLVAGGTMPFEILINILSGVLSLLGVGLFSQISNKYLNKIFNRTFKTETYSEKLVRLMDSLGKSSAELDTVLTELAQVANDREKAVHTLEQKLNDLEFREKELKENVQALENVPIQVVDYFAKLTSEGERRSELRDYALFGAGVVLSTVIAILLKIFGL